MQSIVSPQLDTTLLVLVLPFGSNLRPLLRFVIARHCIRISQEQMQIQRLWVDAERVEERFSNILEPWDHICNLMHEGL